MVNITDEELWTTEPAIRPEDEAVLRKLHEMLQSTADDLKLISGELTKHREPRAHIKPTPLDEEFNEKVHIEEIVNAKFYGSKILDKPATCNRIIDNSKTNAKPPVTPKSKTVNASVQVRMPTVKKASNKGNLTMSRTRIVQIDEQRQADTNTKALMTYKEYSYKHEEPLTKISQPKPLHLQAMPSINIRSELKEQKVLQLDIVPELKTDVEHLPIQSNVSVIAMQHEPIGKTKATKTQYPEVRYMPNAQKSAVRKVSTMLTCDSSESSDNVASKVKSTARNLTKPKVKSIPKSAATLCKESNDKRKLEKPFKSNIDEWRKKINTIYGRPSTSRKANSCTHSTSEKLTKSDSVPSKCKTQTLLNNAEYIPYTKLTLGGVNVSDIEKEISDLPDKNVPLNPILDKILISRENSFQGSADNKDNNGNKNILTTSDENLLEEVLDIERSITTTLNKNLKGQDRTISDISSDSKQSDKSYADDFDEEGSDNNKTSEETKSNRNNTKDENVNKAVPTNIKDTTYTKSPNLSFKNTVDVFEFIHSVDTQESATQSNGSRKISLKSTQTSPRNVQPICNDLWPDPPNQTPVTNLTNDVAKILNEDFIKKLIVDECTDILQKNLTKATTSEGNEKRNFSASQKITQTSPAHAKSVMTSPTRTKTRMTSPLELRLTVDHQTSPIEFPTNEEDFHIELDKVEDLAISINLSSPRFSLRLPRDSREVLSKLEGSRRVEKSVPVNHFISSSSAEADDSSDLSSLGEVISKLRRRHRKKPPSISESTASSTTKYSSDVSSVVLPLRSEGEISLGQVVRKTKSSRSEGEMSLGMR